MVSEQRSSVQRPSTPDGVAHAVERVAVWCVCVCGDVCGWVGLGEEGPSSERGRAVEVNVG